MNDKLGLINKNGKNLLNKEIFEELAKERSDEIIGLTNETNLLMKKNYFKGDTARKSFWKLFEKVKSADIKLEEAKKL